VRFAIIQRVWHPAKAKADADRATMEAEFGVAIEPWDWRYYAEKVRCAKYDFDANELKPYLSLDCMVGAIFDCANRLFGLRFIPRDDVEVYHPDVKAYEVRETVVGDDGQSTERTVGIFMHDNFARPHKRSGAWMSELRSQSRNFDASGAHRYPFVLNNNNFNKGSAAEPTLLSFDDARTLFHEFGHGLHGLLSNVTYNTVASTNVLRDWVELPSQLYEHWLSEPDVLRTHVRSKKLFRS
jgi:peptidyl-dipeptidase Dcp